MNEDVRIRQGATFERTLIDDDMTADEVVHTISTEANEIVLQTTASYTTQGNTRVATIKADTSDLDVANYFHMYTITYSDGHVEKLPDPDEECDCDEGEECELPKFIVCEANDTSGES